MLGTADAQQYQSERWAGAQNPTSVLFPLPSAVTMGGKQKRSGVLSECPDHLSIRQAFEKLASGDIGSPVDFELPRSYMKKKSTEYIAIKRNVYLTKRRIEDDGIFCCCTTTSGKSACDGDCHCGMLFSCCSSSCKCGDKCNNKPFQHRKIKKVKLVKTEKCGLGLIADEDIEKGDFVIEYVGEVIDDKTCEERLWQMKHRGDTNFYLCEVNHDMVIDATYRGNKSRFINHSCEPNTEMQKWRVEGETRIGIFAVRDIKRGDELAYDYQFVQFGADQDCLCGTSSCRQKLGNKFNMLEGPFLTASSEDSPTRRSEIGDLKLSGDKDDAFSHNCVGEVVRIWNSQQKRYFGGVVSDFDSVSRKHIIVYEDGRLEYIDMSKQEWDFCNEYLSL